MLIAAAVLALAPVQARAQGNASEAVERRQLGPLGVQPRVSWQTAYEDNIFRTDTQRVSDFVSTLSGRTDVRGRVRRIGVTASGSADWVHYARIITERGANFGSAVKLQLLFNRFVPWVSSSFDNTRQRINPEIDTRPRLEQSSVVGGTTLRIASKTAIDVSAGRATLAYDKSATDHGVNLGDALNRSSNHVGLSLIQDVTPLTRIMVSGEIRRDRFEVSTNRDAEMMRLTAGFESEGRIRGSARAGVRVHRSEDSRIAESRGFVISAATTADVMDRLQIGLHADRDLVPSFRPDVAYYESYGYGGTMTFALRRSWRVSALVGRQHADYSTGSAGSALASQMGVDLETRYGTGINYRLGDSMSFDVSGMYFKRTSAVAVREFDGMSVRAGVSHAF